MHDKWACKCRMDNEGFVHMKEYFFLEGMHFQAEMESKI